MRRPLLLILTLTFCLSGSESLHAFPEGVAHFILGRPVTEKALEEQLKPLNTIIDPIIKGSDTINRIRIPVGKPRVKLSVLIVEPRHYGFRIAENISFTEKALNYTININGTDEESLKLIQKMVPTDGKKDSVRASDVSPEEIEKIFEEVVRIGSRKVSTDHPRTLFLLNGYGVPKKLGVPLALLLADKGFRVILPDLRGQGESSGKGITWGKEEPRDLSDLLTYLQSKGVVEKEPVGVIGISYGAAMASLWSASDKRVQATMLGAPYKQADTKIVTAIDKFMGGVKIPFKLTEENLTKGTVIAAERLGVTWEEISPAHAMAIIPHPVLLMASTGDEVIPAKEVKEIYQLAPKGSKLHEFQKLPHILIGANFTEMESLIMEWLKEMKFREGAGASGD